MDTFKTKVGASFLTNSKLQVSRDKPPLTQVSMKGGKGSNRVVSDGPENRRTPK